MGHVVTQVGTTTIAISFVLWDRRDLPRFVQGAGWELRDGRNLLRRVLGFRIDIRYMSNWPLRGIGKVHECSGDGTG